MISAWNCLCACDVCFDNSLWTFDYCLSRFDFTARRIDYIRLLEMLTQIIHIRHFSLRPYYIKNSAWKWSNPKRKIGYVYVKSELMRTLVRHQITTDTHTDSHIICWRKFCAVILHAEWQKKISVSRVNTFFVSSTRYFVVNSAQNDHIMLLLLSSSLFVKRSSSLPPANAFRATQKFATQWKFVWLHSFTLCGFDQITSICVSAHSYVRPNRRQLNVNTRD